MTDTEGVALKPDLGRFGVWTGGPVPPEQASAIEGLGYGALWVGGSPAAGLEFAEPILAATEHLQLATGIVNIWTAPADEVAESYHRIEKAYPGRFLLGIGVGTYYFAAVADFLKPQYGDESMLYSLYTGGVFYLTAVVLMLLASRTLRKDWNA